MHELELAHRQLERMRAMNRFYHQRFFSDVRFIATAVVGLFVLGFAVSEFVFLLIPFVAVLGANQTAFDASYLLFVRHYAAAMEREVNNAMRRPILLGSELEDTYVFPLEQRKIVTVAFGEGFTWFGWMTVMYTMLGVGATLFALALGWTALTASGLSWTMGYSTALLLMLAGSVVAGWWWFARGEGERRLSLILDRGTKPTTEPLDAGDSSAIIQ